MQRADSKNKTKQNKTKQNKTKRKNHSAAKKRDKSWSEFEYFLYVKSIPFSPSIKQ